MYEKETVRHEYGNYYICSLEGKPNKWNLDVIIN